MLKVIGTMNVAPATVPQLSPFQLPVWQPHELSITTTLPTWFPTRLTSLPSSANEYASAPTLGRLPTAATATVLLYSCADVAVVVPLAASVVAGTARAATVPAPTA